MDAQNKQEMKDGLQQILHIQVLRDCISSYEWHKLTKTAENDKGGSYDMAIKSRNDHAFIQHREDIHADVHLFGVALRVATIAKTQATRILKNHNLCVLKLRTCMLDHKILSIRTRHKVVLDCIHWRVMFAIMEDTTSINVVACSDWCMNDSSSWMDQCVLLMCSA